MRRDVLAIARLNDCPSVGGRERLNKLTGSVRPALSLVVLFIEDNGLERQPYLTLGDLAYGLQR